MVLPLSVPKPETPLIAFTTLLFTDKALFHLTNRREMNHVLLVTSLLALKLRKV